MRLLNTTALVVALAIQGAPTSAETTTENLAGQLAVSSSIQSMTSRFINAGKSAGIATLNDATLPPEKIEALRLFIVQEWDRNEPRFKDAFVKTVQSHLTPREQEIVLAYFNDQELQAALVKFSKIQSLASTDIRSLKGDVDAAIAAKRSVLENE